MNNRCNDLERKMRSQKVCKERSQRIKQERKRLVGLLCFMAYQPLQIIQS